MTLVAATHIITQKKEAVQLPQRGHRQRPILPGRVQPSTFGTGELNDCVRNGNRWDLSVIVTGNSSGAGEACFFLPGFRSASAASFRPLLPLPFRLP